MTKKIFALLLIVSVLVISNGTTVSSAQNPLPCEDWETFRKTLSDLGFSLASLSSGSGTVFVETKMIEKVKGISALAESLGFQAENITEFTTEMEKLGAITSQEAWGTRYQFRKDDFRPCKPPGAPSGETQKSPNPSGNPNRIVFIALVAIATFICFPLAKRLLLSLAKGLTTDQVY